MDHGRVYTCCKPAGEGVPPIGGVGRGQGRHHPRRQGLLGVALPALGPPQWCHDEEEEDS